MPISTWKPFSQPSCFCKKLFMPRDMSLESIFCALQYSSNIVLLKSGCLWSKFGKQTFFGYPDFPPFCFLSHRLNTHAIVIYHIKGNFVLHNIVLTLIYGKVHAWGPKTMKKKHSAAMLENSRHLDSTRLSEVGPPLNYII